MHLTNIKSKLLAEFRAISKGKNPKITTDIEAVVVLSGESGDPDFKTNLNDTEERTRTGVKIIETIKKRGGNPVLIITGTPAQNKFMFKLAKNAGIKKIKNLKNIPSVPLGSTLDQFKELIKLDLKKIAIVTHAYHGPRVLRYAAKYLDKNCQFYLFLLARNAMTGNLTEEEIKKIIRYSNQGYISLSLG